MRDVRADWQQDSDPPRGARRLPGIVSLDFHKLLDRHSRNTTCWRDHRPLFPWQNIDVLKRLTALVGETKIFELVTSYCHSTNTVRHVLRTCRESCEHIEDQSGSCPLDAFLKLLAGLQVREESAEFSTPCPLAGASQSSTWTIRPTFAKKFGQGIDTVCCISACPTSVDSTTDRLGLSHRSTVLLTVRTRYSVSSGLGLGRTFEELLPIHVRFWLVQLRCCLHCVP